MKKIFFVLSLLVSMSSNAQWSLTVENVEVDSISTNGVQSFTIDYEQFIVMEYNDELGVPVIVNTYWFGEQKYEIVGWSSVTENFERYELRGGGYLEITNNERFVLSYPNFKVRGGIVNQLEL